VGEYLPDRGGRWLAGVRDEALLMLPAERADDLIALWPRLDGDAAAHVIDRLAGSGIIAAPSFALVVRERATGTARALVRGDLRVTLGEVEVSGSGVSTWQERAVDGRPDVRVVVGDAGQGSRLPVVEGVVAASVVDWPGRSSARPSQPATPGEAGSEVAAESVVGTAAEVVVPDERTMVPEDTVVGLSRTERPTFERPTFEPPTAASPEASPVAALVATSTAAGESPAVPVIVPPDFGSTPPERQAPATPGDHRAPTTLGDHDGLTVAATEIRRLRGQRDGAGNAAEGGDGQDGDVGARDAEASAPASPPPALRMPDGSIEPIVGELVLGRAPAIGRVTGTRIPRPVVIGAGDPDISRTHLRVAVEGGTVVVTDLESRNGTQVVAPGHPPLRLRPSEATPVLPDTVIDLGGGWSIQVVVR